MSSSIELEADAVKDIEEIVNGNKQLVKCLEKNVTEMCNVLYTTILLNSSLPAFDLIKEHLSDVYWSLKLHLFFHLGEDTALTHERLRRFGESLKLTNHQLKALPGMEHAIDPGSKVLEAVSITIFIIKAIKSSNLT